MNAIAITLANQFPSPIETGTTAQSGRQQRLQVLAVGHIDEVGADYGAQSYRVSVYRVSVWRKSPVEHRHDLETILLEGLPPDQRRQTVEAIAEQAVRSLARLRRQDSLEQTCAAADSPDLANA
jgi:hypothetical protein